MAMATRTSGLVARSNGTVSSYPSAAEKRTAAGRPTGRAMASSVESGTPVQRAFPVRPPPTWFEMHDSMASSSTVRIARSSSRERARGCSTRPPTLSRQPLASILGESRLMSTT